jgi:hypothetical protein
VATGAVGDPLLEAGLPEAIGLRREIASNQQHAFSVAVYLGLSATNRADLEVLSRRAEDAAARCMAELLPTTLEMAAARVATAPVGVDPVAAERLLPSGVVSTLCPWVWDELRQPRGRLFGFAIRGGSPVLVDTFDEDRFTNANVGLFGHSGAGKTYLMKSLLMADAEQGLRTSTATSARVPVGNGSTSRWEAGTASMSSIRLWPRLGNVIPSATRSATSSTLSAVCAEL